VFRVDLKTFLGLAMPNQYCPTVEKEYKAGFWVIFLGQKPLTSTIPNNYIVTTDNPIIKNNNLSSTNG